MLYTIDSNLTTTYAYEFTSEFVLEHCRCKMRFRSKLNCRNLGKAYLLMLHFFSLAVVVGRPMRTTSLCSADHEGSLAVDDLRVRLRVRLSRFNPVGPPNLKFSVPFSIYYGKCEALVFF